MEKWKTIQEQVAFEAEPYLKVVKQTIELPSGAQIDDFYQVHLRSFVVVVPVFPDNDILVIRQYKHGPGRVSLTFPGGFVDPGEAPDIACRRELLEETGCKVGTLTHMGEFTDNGNQRGYIGNYYVAHNCTQMTAPDSGDLEDMQFEKLSPSQIDQAMKNGDFSIIHHASVWSMARLWGLIET